MIKYHLLQQQVWYMKFVDKNKILRVCLSFAIKIYI